MEKKIKRIGVLTSGGDAPGMNAAVRAVVRTAIANGIECVGIRRGWQGLINSDFVQLNRESVGHILSRGGTILYTARSDEFMTEKGRLKAVGTCKMLGLDGIVAIAVNLLPDRWFGIERPIFKVSEQERSLHKRLKIRKWKDRVWELGGLGGFSKKKLLEPDNPAYVEKFLVECNRGTVVHRLSYPVGFLAMLALRAPLRFTVGIPVATVNLFLNILPTLVLRYNTPLLLSALKRLKRHSNSEKN